MPIVNQFSETIHSHIDTNRYHFVSSEEVSFSSEEDYLSAEEGYPFVARCHLEREGQSARTRVGRFCLV